MTPVPLNVVQGTLTLLILKSIGDGELHGLGIAHRIELITRNTFQVSPGAHFPALHKMEEDGWLISFWGESEHRRRTKYYRLTKAGHRQLGIEAKQWNMIAGAMASAMKAV